MAYTNLSDVKALAPYVPIDVRSTPTEGVVNGWISDQERVLDSIFGSMGYTVPLTGPVARTIAKDLVSHYVMARILRARPNAESDPAQFQKVYDDTMRRLRDPNDVFDLTDAVRSELAVLKPEPTRVSSNLKELALSETRPRINRDQVF